MSHPQYCEPCQNLFSGKVQPKHNYGSPFLQFFVHHPDAKSLKESLQLPCVLCSLAWKSHFAERDIPSEIQGAFTYFNGKVEVEAEDGVRELTFHYEDSVIKQRSETLALVPWQDMQNYQFPSLLSGRTDSPSALGFLTSQYRVCNENHVGCARRQTHSSFKPTRLIDVGGPDSNTIRVCDTQNLAEEDSYTCLSYRWGKTQPLMLTKKTEQKLRSGLPVSTLVKTFRDAIFATRKLGIRYLWIDSLCVYSTFWWLQLTSESCIFQDNSSEWGIEAGRMGYIYSHATCTLAATSAKDSEGGLFFARDPNSLRPLCVEFTGPERPNIDAFHVETMNTIRSPPAGRYWCDVTSTWSNAIERAPLNSRAWVSQERHLSPRILHFTDTQLFWECHEYMSSENYHQGFPEWAFPNWHLDPTILKRKTHQLQLSTDSLPSITTPDIRNYVSMNKKRKIYHHWRSFRIHYSSCRLTKEDDKLVAIQGIAQNLGSILGDNLVAGLWQNRFLEELCWFKFAAKNDPVPCEPTVWRAPTWSWASSNETIWVSNTSKFHLGCPDLQIWAEVHDLDVKSHASGKLLHASVGIRCRPVRASIALEEHHGHPYDASGTLRFAESTAELRVKTFKNSELELTLDRRGCRGVHNIQLFIIQRCAHETVQDDDTHRKDVAEGLLIVPESGSDEVFKRFGMFVAKGDLMVEKMVRQHEAAEEKVITLI